MNRLFTILTLAVSVSLSSCMKTTEDEYKDVRGGLEIYSSVAETQSVAMDPANIAIRLNTLIYEAANAEPAITDLDKVEVPDPEKPDGPKVKISNQLFGNAKVELTDPETGKYVIKYSLEPYTSQNDLVRHGTIVVVTGNKSLYDNESSWSIAPAAGINDSYPYLEVNSGYNPRKIYYSWDFYTISGSDRGAIAVSSNFKGYTNENYKAEWTLNTTIDLGLPEGYFGFKSATREVVISGQSSGKLMGLTNTFSYKISWMDPLTYKPSCSPGFIKSGQVTAEFPDGPLYNPSGYPAADVDVTWVAGSDCKTFVDITYNGVTKRL